MPDYNDVAHLMSTTGLHMYHKFRYASMDYSTDARLVDSQDTLCTFMVGSRSVLCGQHFNVDEPFLASSGVVLYI